MFTITEEEGRACFLIGATCNQHYGGVMNRDIVRKINADLQLLPAERLDEIWEAFESWADKRGVETFSQH
jgi:putative heme iron utilization protein